ncbi:MAG: response regulator [Melioribacteraceae bacterium]|jgi:DNA-binding LytR/AlgR family response regulator|nr:response regulator [Melioribacteraceae bacterium]RJP63665.1 MAG: response regulator [Ignavibacteriales bacterium]WKZ69923.1 MAG: response regulator [Melioribacteraceae bacterium]
MKDKKRILVIEDDPILIRNLKDILEEEGYEVHIAVDGEDGINLAKEAQPNLIICDISIPNKDGYEVLKEISQSDKTKNIPFIFLTAKVEREDLRKGMQLGADDYIFKPFDIWDLLNSIKVRLNKFSSLSKIEDQSKSNENKKYDINDKILVSIGGKSQFCFIRDLKYIKAETPYVKMNFENGKSVLHRSSVNEWEQKLPELYFTRIHRSTIINNEFISKIEKISGTSYIIKLKDEPEPLVVSKRYSSKIRERYT